MTSSRLAIWRTGNISAARIIPAPYGLAYQKYVTQTTQKIPLEEYLPFLRITYPS